ncbi:MAG: MBL fold metallo-hydrolase [Clostridiales bacterium]|jgi:ribonuclease BN (tRNA processing enzyme)|nr:MBL fold metallo-hydrolase [Clostridiales bacterium]
MRFKVLCRYGKYPSKLGGNNSLFLSGSGANIVIDMGSGALSALENNDIQLCDLDAIVLSHLHFDHMSDLLPLVYKSAIYIKEKRLDKKITVYLPETPTDIFSVIKNSEAFDLKIIKDDMTALIKGLKLKFFAMKHPCETYAVRVESDGAIAAYTADTVYNENIKDLISGCKYVFADACVLDKDYTDKSPHISVKNIARLTNESGAKLVLVHLPPDGGLDDILEEAKSENKNSEIADESKDYEII